MTGGHGSHSLPCVHGFLAWARACQRMEVGPIVDRRAARVDEPGSEIFFDRDGGAPHLQWKELQCWRGVPSYLSGRGGRHNWQRTHRSVKCQGVRLQTFPWGTGLLTPQNKRVRSRSNLSGSLPIEAGLSSLSIFDESVAPRWTGVSGWKIFSVDAVAPTGPPSGCSLVLLSCEEDGPVRDRLFKRPCSSLRRDEMRGTTCRPLLETSASTARSSIYDH